MANSLLPVFPSPPDTGSTSGGPIGGWGSRSRLDNTSHSFPPPPTPTSPPLSLPPGHCTWDAAPEEDLLRVFPAGCVCVSFIYRSIPAPGPGCRLLSIEVSAVSGSQLAANDDPAPPRASVPVVASVVTASVGPAVAAMDDVGAKPAKRYYSKGGCRECKRRKIKCDEGKPHCWQCVRLQKLCSYPAAGERVLRVSKRALMDHPSSPAKQFKPGPHPLQAATNATATTVHHQQSHHQPHQPHPSAMAAPPPPLASQPQPPQPQQYLSPQSLPNQLSQPQQQHPPPPSSLGLINTSQRHPPPPSPSTFMLPSFSLPTLPSIPSMAQQVPRHPPSAPAVPTTSSAPSASSTASASPATTAPPHPHGHGHPQPSVQATTRPPDPSGPSSGHPSPLGSSKNPAIVNLLNSGPDASVYLSADDLNLLAEDLNKMLTDIVVDGVDPASLPEMSMGQPQPPPSSSSVPDHNLPLSYINVTAPHEKLYLEEFYSEFAAIVLPFPAWDAQRRQYYNPARDIILKLSANEPFLMAAVLAEGAKSSFKKNNMKDDDDAYRRYLSKCLSLLGPAMRSSNATLTHNVEAVLVTVLLLTSDTASNAAPDWRPHLRGARDLLLKLARQRVRSTPVLVFCKTWFVAFEVLAGISSRGGGTLANDEIDLLLTPNPYEDEMLRGLGVLRSNGFNIFTGAHHDTIPLFRDLAKALAARRRRRALNQPLEGSWEHMRLFTEFWNQLQVSFVTSQGVCSVQEYQAQSETGTVPEGALVDVLRNQVMVSWMDVSHQSFMLAGLITLLTKFFGESHTSPQVQFLTNKLTRFLSVLSEPQSHRELVKCSLMMISWPMYVAGLNCSDESQKYLLMKYFRATAEGGSGTAQHALDRVYSTWKNHKQGLDVDDDDVDRLDIVSY